MTYKIITLNTDQTSLKEVADGETIHLNLPQYADNTDAKNAGLNEGDWYQDNNGVVKIVQP
jgi:hypothetical protein